MQRPDKPFIRAPFFPNPVSTYFKTPRTVLRKGDIIYNPVSGETFTFLKTGADTLGALLQADVTAAGRRHRGAGRRPA
jgi:hypothetical protein